MILLVVGLVAVIVVIVIAVFLSIRLGHSDEHDDEPDISPSSRDQWAEEDRWREDGSSGERRSPQPARAGRGAGVRGSGDGDRRRSGEPAYSGGRARDSAGRAADDLDYTEGPPRRTRRDPSGYESSPARRRSTVPVSADSREHHRTGPSRRAPADDYSSPDYPSMDLPQDQYAGESAADYGEYAGTDYPAVGYPADPGRGDPGRTEAPRPASGKSRSRQHRGKRADADDWPSSEWEKLSDEQYWAELSADKPLATMARPAQPASPEREQGRGQRSRRERPPEYEAVTEHLPVRSRQHPPVPAARPAAKAPADSRPAPAGTHPSLDTGAYPVRDAGRHPSLDAAFPAPGAGRHPSLDTRPGTRRPPVPGALEDDPLTSPSFSLKADPATDSRSYGRARRAPRAAASDPRTGAGRRGSGSYPAASYPGPARGYPAEPAPGAAAGQWSGSPPAPAYRDPHRYPGAAYPGSPAVPAGDAGYDGYQADPMRVYSPPQYQPPASTAHPGAYREQPYGQEPGQLSPPQYPRAAGGSGYPPGYDRGHGSDPYATGEYGVHPPRG